MAYTQTQLDALKEARALGVTEVRYADGKTVKYRSLAEMDTIISSMESDIAGLSSNRTRRYASTSKGL